mgnify:CR=1 FL=1
MAEDLQERYFVREGDDEPREVDIQRWMFLEGCAGFHSKTPGRPATGGFSDTASRKRGSIAYTEEQVANVLARLKEEK